MKKRYQALGAVVIALLFLAGTPALTAHALSENPVASPDGTLIGALKNKMKRGAFFLFGIQSKLKTSEEQLKILRDNKQALQEKIDESRVNVTNLKSQLDNLQRLVDLNTKKVMAARLQIAEYENTVAVLTDAMKQKQKETAEQGQALDEAITAYYLHNRTFFPSGGSQANVLAFLSSDASTGDILRENAYLSYAQDAVQNLAQDLMKNELQLSDQKNQIEEKKQKAEELKILLGGEQRTLQAAQESHRRLLDETQGKQAVYQALLEMSKQEEVQVSAQIQRLRENFSFFQSKLDELGSTTAMGLGPNLADNTGDGGAFLRGETPLVWPVPPTLGISAFFHDSSYKKALGVEHNAVDIRTPQGLNVRAAADGVVTKASDNGYAYSYIIVAHPGGFITLYGHISQILVSEGEIVHAGEVIGLSGGMPGSKGAGWLTTGAHLHFEVFKDWKHVDPLQYLPLEYVPVGSLPDQYIKQLTGEVEKKVQRR